MDETDRAEVKSIAKEVVDAQLKDQEELAKPQDNRLVFQEYCNAARHYSGLRFAMFTVSTTVLGALLAIELRRYGSPPPAAELPRSFILYFRIASLVLAVLFILWQWRVSDLVVFYQEKARDFGPPLSLGTQEKHDAWKVVVRLTMIAPFLIAALFWVWQLVTMICH